MGFQKRYVYKKNTRYGAPGSIGTSMSNCFVFCASLIYSTKRLKVELARFMHFVHKKKSQLFNDTFFCKCPVLIYLHARELFMFLFSSADFLQN